MTDNAQPPLHFETFNGRLNGVLRWKQIDQV